MWRIYSPTHLGIRIGTSTKKLRTALEKGIKGSSKRLRMDDVSYMSQNNLNIKSKNVRDELEKNFDVIRSTDLLFMKREAYEHEYEYRVVVIDDHPPEESKGIAISIKPNQVIDSILIDPRAPKELADALVYYFQEKIGFKKKCEKSRLYKTPVSLVID